MIVSQEEINCDLCEEKIIYNRRIKPSKKGGDIRSALKNKYHYHKRCLADCVRKTILIKTE